MEQIVYHKSKKIDKYLTLAERHKSVIEFHKISKSKKTKTNIVIDTDSIYRVGVDNTIYVNSIKYENEHGAPEELVPFISEAINLKSKLIITTAVSLYEKKMEELYKESLEITKDIDAILKDTKKR